MQMTAGGIHKQAEIADVKLSIVDLNQG